MEHQHLFKPYNQGYWFLGLSLLPLELTLKNIGGYSLDIRYRGYVGDKYSKTHFRQCDIFVLSLD